MLFFLTFSPFCPDASGDGTVSIWLTSIEKCLDPHLPHHSHHLLLVKTTINPRRSSKYHHRRPTTSSYIYQANPQNTMRLDFVGVTPLRSLRRERGHSPKRRSWWRNGVDIPIIHPQQNPTLQTSTIETEKSPKTKIFTNLPNQTILAPTHSCSTHSPNEWKYSGNNANGPHLPIQEGV